MARIERVNIPDTGRARGSMFAVPAPAAADRVAQFAQGVRRHALQEAFAARAADVHALPSEPANLLGVDRREFAEAASGVTDRVAGFRLSPDELERAILLVDAYLSSNQGLAPHSLGVQFESELRGVFRDIAAKEARVVSTLDLSAEQARRIDNDPQLRNPTGCFNQTRLQAVRSVVAASVLGKFEDLCALATPEHAARLRELAPSAAAQHQLLAALAAATSLNAAQFSGDPESAIVRFGKLVLSFEATPHDGYRLAYHQSA